MKAHIQRPWNPEITLMCRVGWRAQDPVDNKDKEKNRYVAGSHKTKNKTKNSTVFVTNWLTYWFPRDNSSFYSLVAT